MFALLNALYDSDSGNVPPAGPQLAADIELFAMHAQIHKLLQRCPRVRESLPQDLRQRLKRESETIGIQNLMLQHTERQILKQFDSHRIAAMPLKGTRFAERFFGALAARATSDIDLLVRPGQLEEAISLVRDMGFILDKKIHNHAVLYRLITPDIPLMVELHWTMDKPHLSELRDEPFWDSSLPMAGFDGIRELDALSTFYFMLLHGMRHRMESPRYLLDLAHMLLEHGETLDLSELVVRARRDRTYRRVQAALSIVYGEFPSLHTRKPLPFDVIETYWTYEAIRDRRLGKRGLDDYRNRMFFRFGIFDTWKHQLLSQQPVYKRLGKRPSDMKAKEMPYG
ncbi:hypothetical protein PA598K_04436 [Paenibacillus sp. 598K]|uniref:nucleotidyltransferase family protein n=1 Tax=Paenibacillus sp. 598K TaxID=1117987 RepID=UPI000FFA4685|nr:nucleotidyltransferase family protein [Paenibacillus sp. 598K]GBF75997.1 hypothetical protein PA598K_04436 [Paenibacillus sp. 598K]